MLNPVEEKEIGMSMYQFNGGDEIVETVMHEMSVERGDIVEVDSEEEDDKQGEEEEKLGLTNAIKCCASLERYFACNLSHQRML